MSTRLVRREDNKKTYYLNRSEFSNLCEKIQKSILVMTRFHPEEGESPKFLREGYQGLYEQCAKYAERSFKREFLVPVMFGIQVEKIDLIEGEVVLSFKYEEARKIKRYILTLGTVMAPYTQEWPQLLKQKGGDPRQYLNEMQLV